jgi:pheromone shutdown protein TraB
MLEFNILAEFSRTNCVAICAFLVPANLVATIATIVLALLHRPSYQLWQAAVSGWFFALVMILHVYTWFSIGVVMAPTYILLWLAITCFFTNVGVILFHKRYSHFVKAKASA